MHMADALVSPAVGGTMWLASAATIACCSRRVRLEMDDRKVPLMGVMGAFIFAAQMINFTIPGTGSSGHLGGGLLLAVLLGPCAAFLTIASVLVVQALFFADGGLLALGCNMFNLGIFPAFIAYPLLYKKIIGGRPSATRMTVAAIVAAVIGLQMGAFCVVLETVASGISALPFTVFVALMQPIHLCIGIVEGLLTAVVISFIYQARPEIMQNALQSHSTATRPLRTISFVLLFVALLVGGVGSWFASGQPDGLEWAVKRITGKEELVSSKGGVHGILTGIQEKLAFLPDYSFRKPESVVNENGPRTKASLNKRVDSAGGAKEKGSRLGTTIAGISGALITLGLVFLTGRLLRYTLRGTSPGTLK